MSDREIIRRYYELSGEGKREEGIAFLEECVKNAGDNVSAKLLSNTGNAILLYLGELEKGIEYFHRAIEKEPENPDTYWMYFTDLDEITDKFPETIGDAVLCLTKIIEYVSNFEPEAAKSSIDNSDKKQYKYSEHLEDNAKKEVDIARRYMDLAVIYMKIPDYKNAEECIDKTLAILPDDNDANSIKNEILVATGRESEVHLPEETDTTDEEIKLDETITDPLLKLEELVCKIDYNGHNAPIPEEWLILLNELTGNNWTEEEYKEFCVEFDYTLEETVYALLHDGEYPDIVENELYFIRSLDKSVMPTLEIRHKLATSKPGDSIYEEFEALPKEEIEKWFTEYFAGWEKTVKIKEDKESFGSYDYGETSLYFKFTGEREYGYTKKIKVCMSNNKRGFVWSKNLTSEEWKDVVDFFKKSGDYTLLER